MEARKIIQFGNSSHVISLPKSWLKENGLKKGDLIFVERNGNGELVLSPKERSEERKEKKIVIDAEGKDFWTLRREINSNYVGGYDLMIIKSKNMKKKEKEIKQIVEGLIGNQIIERTQTEIKVKNILDIKGISLIDVMRRVDNILRSMFLDIKEGLATERFKSRKVSEIVEADKEINKLYFLLWKIIKKGLEDEKVAKILNKNSVDLSYTQLLILNLESLGDEIKRIARLLGRVKLSRKQLKELNELITILEKNYTDAMISYYRWDKQSAREVVSRTYKTKQRCEKFAEKSCNATIGGIEERLKGMIAIIHSISKSIAY